MLMGKLSGKFSGSIKGPLRVNLRNPRYFTDGSCRVVYLTGAHTWSNFKDMGRTDPPLRFDFKAYLEFLEEYKHNFIRLWTWELTTYSYNGKLTYAEPFPWLRTGPGTALDGKPKFDLKQFNKAFFDRLHSRVEEAGKRGIYVSVMLFEGHGLHASLVPWCWDGHPFNIHNNISGIDGDPDQDGRGLETHTLKIPAIIAIQEAYVSKVIDTVNDLDNVLYEIANESGTYSTEWQYYMIRFIHEYEKSKPKQHPVGMTFQWAEKYRGTNENLFNSPADWISPSPDEGYKEDPPTANGSKVILSDTDHLWGIGGNQSWVWKSFCRGLNPLFMDPYKDPRKDEAEDYQKVTWTDHLSETNKLDPRWDSIRRSLGYTMIYADRMNLVEMTPHNDLTSTKYCLANPGVEYLVYIPQGEIVTVDLSSAKGKLSVEWFDPNEGHIKDGGKITGGGTRTFRLPIKCDAVLYIQKLRTTR